jgi:hypothetical protein
MNLRKLVLEERYLDGASRWAAEEASDHKAFSYFIVELPAVLLEM